MSKSKKPKLKNYIVTQTIYVSVDIKAKNEDEAYEKFCLIEQDRIDYENLIAQSEHDINIEEVI